MHRSFSAPSTAALQRVFRCRPRHQRGNSDQCQRTYTRHASFPPHIAMPTRCRSDLCTRCAQPASTRSSSMQRTGVLLSEQSRAAQHAGHLRCQWRRSIRRCRRAAGAGLIRACSARRVKWCCQTEGTQISGGRHAFGKRIGGGHAPQSATYPPHAHARREKSAPEIDVLPTERRPGNKFRQ